LTTDAQINLIILAYERKTRNLIFMRLINHFCFLKDCMSILYLILWFKWIIDSWNSICDDFVSDDRTRNFNIIMINYNFYEVPKIKYFKINMIFYHDIDQQILNLQLLKKILYFIWIWKSYKNSTIKMTHLFMNFWKYETWFVMLIVWFSFIKCLKILLKLIQAENVIFLWYFFDIFILICFWQLFMLTIIKFNFFKDLIL
jgi:hypothetical protein